MKRVKIAKFDWEHCLCHIRRGASDPLTAFTRTSLATLLRTASIRQDDVFTFLETDNAEEENPKGGYHRQCYQAYTNKSIGDNSAKQRNWCFSSSSIPVTETEKTEAEDELESIETVREKHDDVFPLLTSNYACSVNKSPRKCCIMNHVIKITHTPEH